MEIKETKGSPESAQTTEARKPYQRPQVQAFGKLHLVTQGTGPANGDAGQGMMPPAASDRIAKENITRIGTHPLGIGLYLFDYKPEYRRRWGSGRQFGVIAQEVEAVLPEAVHMDPDGYRTVDYAMLGISHRLQ